MKRYLSSGILSLALVLTGLGVAAGAQGRWELMGRREVDFRGDHDRIEVGGARGLIGNWSSGWKVRPLKCMT